MPATLTDARPTFLIDGREQPKLGAALLRLTIAETTDGLFRCEAAFGNWGEKDGAPGFLFFDRQTIEFGKKLQVRYAGETLFEGKITALEAVFAEGRAPEIEAFAEDRLQDLRMQRRTRTFENVTDADIFRRVAQDAGLEADVDLDGPQHKAVAQVNQSDLAFLRDRARAIGAEIWVNGAKLGAKKRNGRGGNPVKLKYGDSLRSFRVAADLANQFTSVVLNGWDVSAKEGIQHAATEEAVQPELSGQQSGASILRSAFGERKQSLAHTFPATAQEAKAAAESYFRENARRFVRGHGVAEASGKLRVGTTVELEGLGPLFNGAYYISESRVVFDGTKGVRSEFVAERPGLKSAA